jgi:hypothetical protein
LSNTLSLSRTRKNRASRIRGIHPFDTIIDAVLDKNLIFSPVDCGEIRLFVGRRLLNGRRINQFAQRPNVIGRIERHDRRYSGFHESAQILVSESKAQRCPMVGNERRRQLGDQMRLTLPILLLTSILIAGCARQSFEAPRAPGALVACQGRTNTSRWCSGSRKKRRMMRWTMRCAGLTERSRDRRPTSNAAAKRPEIVGCSSGPELSSRSKGIPIRTLLSCRDH